MLHCFEPHPLQVGRGWSKFLKHAFRVEPTESIPSEMQNLLISALC